VNNKLILFKEEKFIEESGTLMKSRKEIRRGTWFFQENDQWIPFPKYQTELLENEIQKGKFEQIIVSTDPTRIVMQVDGCFRQFRQTRKANPEGRLVLRGYDKVQEQVLKNPTSDLTNKQM